MVANAAWETGWGTSNFAQNRNNLYGWDAQTENPGEADTFATKAACIRHVMERVKILYLEEDGPFYDGGTLAGMDEYADDDNWQNGIVSIMNDLAAVIDVTRNPSFETGDNVITTGAVNVRSEPEIGDNVRFTVRDETTGRVVGGSQEADGFIWWQIEYDNGISGWSVQRYLNIHADSGGEFQIGNRVATTADLSVREGASTDYERKEVIPEGGAGYIREGPINRGGYTWWKIGYNAGVEGWSVEAYLENAPLETQDQAMFDMGQRVSTTTDLSVRAAAGTDHRRKDVIDEGGAGYIRGGPVDSDGFTWWKIGYNAGVEGWSAERYLEAHALTTGKFEIGQEVETTTGLSVRENPTTDAERTDVAPSGMTGTVRDGPSDADGYTWWEVEYQNGSRGWSAENWLVEPSEIVSDLIWPVSGDVTSGYNAVRGDDYHHAVDIAAWTGTDVIAAAPGTAYPDTLGAGGKTVWVYHENGYRTGYMHLSSRDVYSGQQVEAGDKIGEVGDTGESTGPHLHLQITRDGVTQFIPGTRGDYVEQGEPVPQEYSGL
jgi:murein DD-endopeptidase MepM/ murein hydrolase activator NlpD